MKTWIVAILLAIVVLSPSLYLVYYSKHTTETQYVHPTENEFIGTVQFTKPNVVRNLEVGAEFEIQACRVMDGYRFQVVLEGNKTIEAHLTSAVKDDAGSVVIDILNKARFPTVILRRQVGDFWIVDFNLTWDGRRTTIIELLKAKGLLFS